MKSKTFIVTIFVLLGVCGNAGFRFFETPTIQSETEPLEVTFSHESGFYNTSFELSLTAPQGAVIYYAVDGKPTTRCVRDTDFFTRPPIVTDITYTAPIRVNAGVLTDVFTIRAFAEKDGQFSQVVTRNYVKGIDVNTRFCDNTLVFVLSSEPHGLEDHHDGILVHGIDRERWKAQNPGKGPGYTWGVDETPGEPANFNRKGEESGRRAYVEVFDSKGNTQVTRDVEMRIKGGYSRAHSQKSLELYARDKQGNWEPFLYPFFDEHSADGNIMNRYRRIRLRNGGSDRSAGFVRDELGHTLLRQAGFPDTQMHTPAAVFLNGEYYGVSWAKTPRTENHFVRKYGGVAARYGYLEGGENYWENDDPAIIADWENNVYNFARGGLTNDSRWALFQERVDIDNFMLYYAFQIYIQNQDWPNHNMEMWRYFPTEEEKNDPNLHPHLRDGKWRWSPHDLEASWNPWGDVPASINTIHNILNGGSYVQWQGTSALLNAVLARPEMKARFANTLVDLIEGVMRPENVNEVLDGLISQIQNEHSYALRVNMIEPVDAWGRAPEWAPSEGGARDSRNRIRDYAEQRPNAMYDFISTTLGSQFNRNSDNIYRVWLETSSGGGAVMNSRPVSESETIVGNYYNGTSINITAKPYPGYAVDYWTVNNSQIYSDDVITVSNAAEVELHFKETLDSEPLSNLFISAVKATAFNSRGDDWIEIHNPTDKTISTRGLFISDGSSNLYRWQMPSATILPGETSRFITNGNEAERSDFKKRTRLGFNTGFGERLRLCDADGNVLSFVEIGLMNQTQVQRRGNDGKYRIDKPLPLCNGCGDPLPCYDCTPPAAIQIVARDSTTWGNSRSTPIEISHNNGTFTETVTIIVGQPRLVNLALMTSGGEFRDNYADYFSGIEPVADSADSPWWNARVSFDEIIVNGNIQVENTYTQVPLIYQGGTHNGQVFVPLWDAWNPTAQRLSGVNVNPFNTGSSPRTEAAIVGAPTIMTITITFTVSGI